MTIDPNKPFNELPLLPPKADIETKTVLKKAITANRALAELKGASRLLPNQNIIINTLALEEARDSSAIENIITTRDKLFRALVTDPRKIDPVTKEVLNYRKALWKGFTEVQKKGFISTNIIIDIQKELISNNAGIRKLPGTVLENDITGEIIYTPPLGESIIYSLLKNFENYLNTNTSNDPLVKLAVLHYQFEAIHPFYDGNGRTGRIINVLYLTFNDLIQLPVLYLSGYIIKNKEKYYQLLRKVTYENNWEEWILFMLNAVETTAIETTEKVNKILDLLNKTALEVKEKLPRIYSKELIELIFHQVYCNINFLVENKIGLRKTASKYLNALASIGVLKPEKIGKEVIFLNTRLYKMFKEKK
ncbi:Hypothetical protein IALB_1233 [Ignavibacterium album JCM 16511]|uniref:Fido domain-containing protein n=1 Tax=Ignavibacterium album (strain DSM 19864 / JCM 16511 / NBRC 101810 / Mat9-16) TaxID=945713 RepID=I0AIY7_IGNAJ|nr:Fic family protein [Ignavibacterium album]AFH48944.1 Hypothetical protein IALB_1233 [Ignavibacterium album JCM 16511]